MSIHNTTLNYGISYRFAFNLIITSLGLFIAGVWIVKICLKVMGVKVPADYFWKPLLVAGITAIIVRIFLLFVPMRALMDEQFGELVGGIAFTVIMVLGGVLIFISIGLLFDVMNHEDGLFWKKIIDGMGPVKILVKPLLKYCGFLLRHQIKGLVSPPVQWVLSTDKKTLESDAQFRVKVIPMSEAKGSSEHGVELIPEQEVKFVIEAFDIKVPLYNVLAYCRIDFTKIPASMQYVKEIAAGVPMKIELAFHLPAGLRRGSHELIVDLEVYETPRDDISPNQFLNKGLWSYWDYRMRWLHEEEFFIYL